MINESKSSFHYAFGKTNWNREGATKAAPARKQNAASTYNEFIRDPHPLQRCKVAAINFTTLNNNIYGR